jgi:uncharacterized protein YyaL (SSP411 family)
VNSSHINRLINETSPYLLQHAHNPVDWYPWSNEALERARKEDKPILLSIGYSACHWCHVMEKECFENAAIAALMNKHFICIKVDREEHPDIDHIYMEAVQAMTGGGGWPLTVFLTPQGEPFYGGSYFPPEDRHGLPGLPQVLMAVSEAYNLRRSQIAATAQELTAYLRQKSAVIAAPQPLTVDILDQAYHMLSTSFDHKNGGFGSAPKFPQPLVQEFLLRYHHRSREQQALSMVQLTLDRMAAGGIYDQVGGGFHRYATDAHWAVPHFEKMLYDNALLSRLYLHAYQATGKPLYRHIAEETLDYVTREMTDPSGGFYSAQDADSEGGEGEYYLWTAREILNLLGQEDGKLASQYFDVSNEGNFEGKNVLHVPQDMEIFAREINISREELETTIERLKRKLLAARQQRLKPNHDEKIVTSWNGMMLQSFAEAACILGREDYRRVAAASADFLLHELRHGDGLMHSYRDGASKIPGYLDDYALLVSGLLALHEATFEQRWLDEAVSLADVMNYRFADKDKQGVFYDTGQDHSALFVRSRDTQDSVKPCGSSAAAEVLLRLAVITGEESYLRNAAAMLGVMREQMLAYPLGSGHWLCALDFHLADPMEIVMVGSRDNPETQVLLQVIYDRYLPNKVLAGVHPSKPYAQRAGALFKDRTAFQGHSTVYLCTKYSCQAPITDPDVLQRELKTQGSQTRPYRE